MRASLRVVLVIFSLLLVSSLQAREFTYIDQSEIEISSINLELDTEWPDSIYYWDPEGAPLYWNGIGYWSGHKFTAPADFTLQAVRVQIYNQYHISSDAEVWIMHHDEVNDQPGEDYYDHASWTSSSFDWGWNECEFDEEDYIELEEGEIFWIVYGPAPGGNHNNQDTGWWPLFANPGETTDSKTTSGANRHGNYFNRGLMHLKVTALGELVPYTDPEIVSIRNDIDKFFYTPDDTVYFMARVNNGGTLASSDFRVEFSVADSLGFELFNNIVDVQEVQAGESFDLMSSTFWNPLQEGYFIASAEIIEVENDADPGNNSAILMQQTFNTDLAYWYAYDDGTFEARTNFSDLNGIGAGYKPAVYPAQVDSVAYWFEGTQVGEIVTLQAYFFDSFLGTMDLVWQIQHPILEHGWVYYQPYNSYNDVITLQRGHLVLITHADIDGITYHRDINEPISAANSGMHSSGYNFHENPNPSAAGNWGIRALIAPGVAPEIVFPADSLDFGAVELGGNATIGLPVINNGDGRVIIDSMIIGQDEITYTGDWPFIVEPNSQSDMMFQFTPGPGTSLGEFQGGMMIWHNDILSPQSPMMVNCLAHIIPTASIESESSIPAEYFLSQNYPNPFNASTRIEFGLKQAGYTSLSIYNTNGQLIEELVNEHKEAGRYSVHLNAKNYPSGLYFCTIQSGNYKALKKMLLIK